MSKIRIKNIGPIVDSGDITLSAVMLIVGKQSSGKSTFMKILCFCRWIEKRIMLDGENLLKKYTHYGHSIWPELRGEGGGEQPGMENSILNEHPPFLL